MSKLKWLFKPSSDCLIIHLLCVVHTDETSGSDEETMHYYCPASDLGLRSRKKKKPKAQSKTSQSLFSVIISVNHGLVALQTNAKVNSSQCFIQTFLVSGFMQRRIDFPCFSQKEDKTILKNKHGEFWLEVKNAVLFSVTQYEGYKDQHYLCFHTSNICMYHQGKPTALQYNLMLLCV